MKNRRYWIALAVVLLMIGIGAFLVYDMNPPVQHATVYELPDNREATKQTMPTAYTASFTGDSQSSKPIEEAAVEDSDPQAVDLAQTNVRLQQEVERLEAEKARLLQRKAELETRQAEPERIHEEAREFRDWLVNEFYVEFKQTLDDGQLIADHDLTTEEIQMLYPDVESIQRFLSELVEARKQLVTRLADLSPSVREPTLRGLWRGWGHEVVDELEQSVAQELRERGTR